MSALIVWLCVCSSLLWTAEATNRYVPQENFRPPSPNLPISVVAYFDMNGIQGNITFSQNRRSSNVKVVAMFDGLDQFGEDERWGWHVHDCPINFALLEEFPCSTSSVGGHFDPDDRRSNENYTTDCMPETSEECELGDLSGRFGRLLPNISTYRYDFGRSSFNLYDQNTFVGRSVVIHRTDGFRWACANIGYDAHNRLDTFVARFPKNPKEQINTLQGDVVLRRSTGRTAVSISSILHRVDGGPVDIAHKWNLRYGTCDSLGGVYKPIAQTTSKMQLPYSQFSNSHITDSCATDQRLCDHGDLSSKCGDLQSDEDGRIKMFCSDTQLGALSPAEFPNTAISLVIEDEMNGTVLACSCFEAVQPKVARATMERKVYERLSNGRYRKRREIVDLYLYQSDPHDPTYYKLYTNALIQADEIADDHYIQIREIPVDPDNKNCSNLGPVFEPRSDFEAIPEIDNVIQTGDGENIGELRNKIPLMVRRRGRILPRNSWLPLFGFNSIIGRSLVLHDGNGTVLNCANIIEETTGDSPATVSMVSVYG